MVHYFLESPIPHHPFYISAYSSYWRNKCHKYTAKCKVFFIVKMILTVGMYLPFLLIRWKQRWHCEIIVRDWKIKIWDMFLIKPTVIHCVIQLYMFIFHCTMDGVIYDYCWNIAHNIFCSECFLQIRRNKVRNMLYCKHVSNHSNPNNLDP